MTDSVERIDARHGDDPFQITSSDSRADAQTISLKSGETFAVIDKHGDIGWNRATDQGLYHAGTRMLSQLGLTLNGQRPLLLSSTAGNDNIEFTVDLTNPQIDGPSDAHLAQGTVHLRRSIVLHDEICYCRLAVHNYDQVSQYLTLQWSYAADFADLFEVRGTSRPRRGVRQQPDINADGVTLSYLGLDGETRATQLCFSPEPTRLDTDMATFTIVLEPQGDVVVDLAILCSPKTGDRRTPLMTYPEALAARQRAGTIMTAAAQITSSDRRANDWIERAQADLNMLVTETEYGPYPYAGIPWFSTVFGRDGIITALQTLWQTPAIARGVLGYLAAHQATSVDPLRDAEPGKILHEVRHGEMAALGEIPFGRYYGTVDATPLFVLLAGAYYRRTGDRAFVQEHWSNIRAALDWIEQFGDRDGDGFVEYARHNEQGLINQGWKDSHDAIFHADGSDAVGPIALCEVQGYVYAAYLAAADLASVVGEPALREPLLARADALRQRFDEAFWLEDLGTYALALDGQKQPCRVRTSNAGQCLYTGIAFDDRAEQVVKTLMEPNLFSGWGVRTLATDEARYNPMSYHNGSIWPHDNALIAAGCARYGFTTEALRIATALFDASQSMEFQRLPELFCGFSRESQGVPTLYPVACAPQAWASGAVPLLLAACLGLEIDAVDGLVRLRHPVLPDTMDEVLMTGLMVGTAELDLAMSPDAHGYRINVVRRAGPVEIVMTTDAPG